MQAYHKMVVIIHDFCGVRTNINFTGNAVKSTYLEMHTSNSMKRDYLEISTASRSLRMFGTAARSPKLTKRLPNGYTIAFSFYLRVFETIEKYPKNAFVRLRRFFKKDGCRHHPISISEQ